MAHQTNEKLMEIIKLLTLLGNPTRVKILALLSKSPMYLSEITKIVGVTQQAVIRHLRELENAGLVKSYTIHNPLGPSRKYYEINHSLHLNITIGPEDFLAYLHPLAEEEQQDEIKVPKSIDKRLNELIVSIRKAQQILKSSVRDKTEISRILSELKSSLSVLYFLETEIERLIESLENLKV